MHLTRFRITRAALLPLLVFLSASNGTWVSFLIAVILMVCVGYCAAQFLVSIRKS